jgi:hypothetical protein
MKSNEAVLVETLKGAAESEKVKLASDGEPIVNVVLAALADPPHDTLAAAVNAPGTLCDALHNPVTLALLITPP